MDGIIRVKHDSFGFQQLLLDFITFIGFEGNFSVAVYNPVPGKSFFFGAGVKYPCNLSCGLGIPCRCGKNPISTDLPFGNFFYQVFYG